jgi:NhaA family Na+:H+ antiporter
VTIGGLSGLTSALSDPIALGIVFGLVVGKVTGIFGTTLILSAVTRASLDSALRWIDVFGMALLAGIGFTVSLLIGELAYGPGSEQSEHVKIGVLTGSLLAAALAAVVLRLRNRHYRSICDEESRDDDHDGIPDVYEESDTPRPT